MITRCQQRGFTCATWDGLVSDQAAAALQIARFPSGHRAVCDCIASNGQIQPSDCAGLTISDSDGKEVARFSGLQFKAKQSDDGGVIIFRIPVSQKKLTETQDHAMRIHKLNEEHAKFYERGPIA
jgi:hypothetical protein